MFLSLHGSYSRWIEVHPMSNIISKATINSWRHSFTTHGLPHIIVMDNGTSFTSNEFKTFCTINGIKHITTAPYHPPSNGPTERAVLTLKSSMKKICENSNSDLITSINRFLLSYRSTPHSSTLLSPVELPFNRKIKTCLTLLKPHINKIMDKEERHLISLKIAMKTWIFYPGYLLWVRNVNKRENLNG